jgi:Arc/MetJ family transcription regulator
MPITSVNVDTEMVEAAKEIYGVRTTKEAIDLALRETVQRHRQLHSIRVLADLGLEFAPQKPADAD